MSDALLSAPVAIVGEVIAASLIVIASTKIRKSEKNINPALMGVMGAFIFAAQMINFTIPGTGSSGHIVGGILLSCLLGAWPAFLTLSSVLIIQSLLFADGGILAMGWNIINMAASSCLIAYPLIMKPFLEKFKNKQELSYYNNSDRNNLSDSNGDKNDLNNNQDNKEKKKLPVWGFILITILSCLIGLEIGAFGVTIETLISGITSLPFDKFLAFMLSIHFFIGIGEGLATSAILVFILKYKPELIINNENQKDKKSYKGLIWKFAIAAILVGGVLSWYASSFPDGLEWSIEKVETASTEESPTTNNKLHNLSKAIQDKSSVFPDYSFADEIEENNDNETQVPGITSERTQTSAAGISGALMVLIATIIITFFISRKRRNKEKDSNYKNEKS